LVDSKPESPYMNHASTPFNGLGLHLGTLSRLSNAESRSISPENPTGAKSGGARFAPETDEQGEMTGPARKLGKGWKVRPSVVIKAGETFELADIDGP